MTRLVEVLEGKEGNYILPLVWQRGEDEAAIREELEKIHDSGIRSVCVEARPHPDFLGPRWWHDMDIIMEEARNRSMRVWIFDDDHFPTGHAAGRLVGAPVELRRLFLKEQHIDGFGPQKKASFLVRPWLLEGDTLVGVVAAQRGSSSDGLTGEMVDLTSSVHSEIVYWDIPTGYWRIFLLISTPVGGSEAQKDYINPITPESVRILIDAVYEPFFEHYRDDFGQTLAGFFSDEPGFYNDRQTYDYSSSLGKRGVVLPWRADFLTHLEKEFGGEYRKYLPLLWHDGSEQTARVRFAYMNLVSKLYAEHFTEQIGSWCRAHRVEYIGHVLEDNGVHAGLGAGAGHYFRALGGQDMAGIDVVLWQLVPGFDEGPFANIAGDADGEFFHYGLAKMASSLAHIDPRKKGRAMCEVFGAYGWSEGLKLMKWITDHMLVRGINHFVPHAFSQAGFPDPECPPHFYARGKNPQYRYYRELNRYTNRISHLLSGGRHVASVAVLYHAEAEWSGMAMPFHKPVKALMQGQVDCDVLPGDILLGSASVLGGKLLVEAESYDCLIVPYCEALPAGLLSRLVELVEQGLPLLFMAGLPTRSSDGRDATKSLKRLSAHDRVQTVLLQDLTRLVRNLGFCEIEAEGEQPSLRHYHGQYPGLDVYMFFNEHPYQSVATNVRIPASGRALLYDAFKNEVSELDCVAGNDNLRFSLRLSPYESLIIVAGEGVQNIVVEKPRRMSPRRTAQEVVIQGPWSIATATAEQYPSFAPRSEAEHLSDMSHPAALPAFSGTFRYETGFDWAHREGMIWLDLGEVYETMEVWVNGQAAGVRICPPYRLDISELVRPGKNTLIVEVTNTLAKAQRDSFSRFAQQEPSGLIGPVCLIYEGN